MGFVDRDARWRIPRDFDAAVCTNGSRVLGLRRILRDAKPIPDLGPGIYELAVFVVPGSTGASARGFFCHKPGGTGEP